MPRVRLAEAPADAYGSRSVNRARRTHEELEELRAELFEVARTNAPLTVRGLFYQLVSSGHVEKTERAYRGIVRIAGEMRLAGDLPWEWLEDGTRWQRKTARYDGLGDMLSRSAELYRRELWAEGANIEFWLEKDALAGVVFGVTDEWGIPLMVARGYASLSFLHSSACAIEDAGRPTFVYLLTYYDPSGLDIGRQIERRIREFAPSADVTFTRLGVSREQIQRWNLPTRPTKQSDSRAAKFEGESVELDAIPPNELRSLVREAIERHVDRGQLDRLRKVEAAERDTLQKLAGRWARKEAANA